MSFRLKNAEATYYRLVTKMFKDYIGKSMKVYVGDILVTSKNMGGTMYQILMPLYMSSNDIK